MTDRLRCVCSGCDKEFVLTADDDDPEKGLGRLVIQSCESGGIYGAYIRCPYCRHEHELS